MKTHNSKSPPTILHRDTKRAQRIGVDPSEDFVDPPNSHIFSSAAIVLATFEITLSETSRIWKVQALARPKKSPGE